MENNPADYSVTRRMLTGWFLPHVMDSVIPLVIVAQALSVAVRIACSCVGPDAIRQFCRPWNCTHTSTRTWLCPRLR
jgi:hypothetical protein